MQKTKPPPERTPHYGDPVNPAGRKAARPAAQAKTVAATSVSYAPFYPDPDLTEAGRAATLRAFNSRSWDAVNRLGRDATSNDPARERNGWRALLGCAYALADILSAARRHREGVIDPAAVIPARGDLRYAFVTHLPDFAEHYRDLRILAEKVAYQHRDLLASESPQLERRVTEIERDPSNLEAVRTVETRYK